MSAHFQTRLGAMHHVDAFAGFATLPDASVRLVVADPPYGMRKAEWDTFASRREYVEWSLRWIREAARVLDDLGTLYVMGLSETLADIKYAASEHFEGCRWLVWYYRNKANLGTGWGRAHEAILCFRKTRRAVFNVDSVRIPYNNHTLRYPGRRQAATSQFNRAAERNAEHYWTPHPLGAKPKDVFEVPTLCNGTAEKTSHPTQKPIDLIRRFVLASSNPGDLVLDPFAGSGTTLLASEENGRRWLGFDSDIESCVLTAKRLSNPNEFSGEQTIQARASEVRQRRARLRHSTPTESQRTP